MKVLTAIYLLLIAGVFGRNAGTIFRKLRNFQELAVEGDASIFFLETSFVFYVYRKLWISDRAACATESAALHHPNRRVHLIFAAPRLVEDTLPVLNSYLNVLETYENVRVSQMDIEAYLEGTPAKGAYFRDSMDASPYRVDHYSDLLRVALLWRNGGIYLDHDVIVLRAFDGLGADFIGAEDEWNVSPGIMGFTRNGPGHDLLTKHLVYLGPNYTGTKFTEIGPESFTDLIKDFCRTSEVRSYFNRSCSTIRILDPEHFYAIPCKDWMKFFDEKYQEEVARRTERSYAVHFWYTVSRSAEIRPNVNAAYVKFAQKHCPRVYKSFAEGYDMLDVTN